MVNFTGLITISLLLAVLKQTLILQAAPGPVLYQYKSSKGKFLLVYVDNVPFPSRSSGQPYGTNYHHHIVF